MRRFRFAAALIPCVLTMSAACGDGASDVQTTGAAGGGQAGNAGKAGSASNAAGAAGSQAGAGGNAPAGASGASGTTAAGTSGSAGTAGAAGGSGAGGSGAAGTAGGPVGCTSDNQCELVATVPPGCAKGTCTAGACTFAAVDADGDGHATSSCKPADTSVIVKLGDDCDDKSPAVFPGAWDGPAGDGQLSACGDGIDQDCSGVADDGKTKAGGTCICTPGDVRACAQDDAGKTIVFPVVAAGAAPLGECRRGAQTCLAGGSFGPCTGTIAPTKESCNEKDDDCDGKVDLTGDAVPNDAELWLYDQDDDLHAASTTEEVKSCFAPAKGPCADQTQCPAANEATGKTHWRVGIPKDDCLDTDKGVYPGATEICNGKDDDCNAGTADATAAGSESWYWDGDGDGFVSALEAVAPLKGCTNPGADIANCRGAEAGCTERFIGGGSKKDGEDCDDAADTIFPGAWDGPATRSYGLDALGLRTRVYAVAPGIAPTTLPSTITFSKDTVLADVRTPNLGFHYLRNPYPTRPNDFVLDMEGTLVAPETGTYTFEVEYADDQLLLRVGETTVFDLPCCSRSPAEKKTATLALVAGELAPVRLSMFQRNEAFGLRLYWSGPGVPRQIVSPRSAAAVGTQSDRCDGLRQNCNASAADATTLGGASCAAECAVGEIRLCGPTAEQAAFPKSACRQGEQRCGATGRWLACEQSSEPTPELCGNGLDDDCNGQVDESNTVYYLDADGDGRGDPTKSKSGCGVATGYVTNTGDDAAKCGVGADTKPAVYVGAPELCDKVDNNCDGKVDEGYGVGTSCTILDKPYGACKNGGTRECTPAGGSECVSRDAQIGKFPGVYLTKAAKGARPNDESESFDWNCNGQIERELPITVGTSNCATLDAAASSHCTKRTTPAECTATPSGYTQCPIPSPFRCGQPVKVFNCQWNAGPTPSCGLAPTTGEAIMGCR